jgi:hypothetical protein
LRGVNWFLPLVFMVRLALVVVVACALGNEQVAAQSRVDGQHAATRAVPAPPKRPSSKASAPAKPVVLPAHAMHFTRLGASAIWADRRMRDSLLARPGWFWLEPGGLLYRAQSTDTVLVLIALERPPNPFDAGEGAYSGTRSVLYQDLNRDGSPEALVGFWRHWDGSGSRGSWVGVNLIEATGTPRLLLSAVIENTESGWGPDPSQPASAQEIFTTHGWERPLKLGGLDIRVLLQGGSDHDLIVAADQGKGAPVLCVGRAYGHSGGGGLPKCTITALKPGRYQFRNGRLVWAGK